MRNILELLDEPARFDGTLCECFDKILRPQYGPLPSILMHYRDVVLGANDDNARRLLHFAVLAVEPEYRTAWGLQQDNDVWKTIMDRLLNEMYTQETAVALAQRFVNQFSDVVRLLTRILPPGQTPHAHTASSDSPPPDGSTPMNT